MWLLISLSACLRADERCQTHGMAIAEWWGNGRPIRCSAGSKRTPAAPKRPESLRFATASPLLVSPPPTCFCCRRKRELRTHGARHAAQRG